MGPNRCDALAALFVRRLGALEPVRYLHADAGGLDYGIHYDARRELEFVGGLSSDERDESMGTGLNFDLRDHLVLHHLGDDTDEAVTRRLRAGALWRRARGGGDRQFGEILTVERAATVVADG